MSGDGLHARHGYSLEKAWLVDLSERHFSVRLGPPYPLTINNLLMKTVHPSDVLCNGSPVPRNANVVACMPVC